MKRNVTLFAILLCAAAPIAVMAQAPSTPPAPAAATPPPPPPNTPIGTPMGLTRLQNRNSTGFPVPQTNPGQPIETRGPEKADDAPLTQGQTRAPYRASAPYAVAVINDQLKLPWSVAILPSGNILVTEKAGTMRLINAAGALSEPLKGVPASVMQGQMGLLDLALDNNFARNRRIFFSYSEGTREGGSEIEATRIVIARATLDEAGLALSDLQVIFRAGPALPRSLGANAGGKLAVAKDNTIFATIGDRSGSPPWDMAQRLDTDLGKIIHITAEGAPAKNNPFLNKVGALPEIWSIGHRSEEGLAVDPVSGAVWEHEHGARGGDKLQRLEAGKNYGWPLYSHGLDYPGTPIGTGQVSAPGTEQPVYYWDPSIAPAGLAFYRGNLFPQWKNSVFVGALRGQMVVRLEMAGGKVVAEEPLLVEQKERVRDVRVSAEGALYVLTDNRDGKGKLLKLTPK